MHTCKCLTLSGSSTGLVFRSSGIGGSSLDSISDKKPRRLLLHSEWDKLSFSISKYHTHFFLTWKKIKGGSISFAAWLCLRHKGNFERLLLTKWCFTLRICNKNPAILSIWADTASSQHKSTYITSLSESSVRCTSAVLIFMKFLLSFSSCIWMCDWNISSHLPLFICRKCRRVCWNVLQWKQSPFHVRFWLGVSAIQLNEG